MTVNIPSEIIELEAEVSYKPTKVITDKRNKQNSTIGYYQIGADAQQGNAKGPVFRMAFVDLAGLTATHVKLYGIKNTDTDGVEVPITYLAGKEIDLYLSKFEFTDGTGNVVTEDPADYQVLGYKFKQIPLGAI